MVNWNGAPLDLPGESGVYLVHLDSPLGQSAHYLGYAPKSIRLRFVAHRKGQGARMLQVARERGLTFRVVRCWIGMGSWFERYLKRQKHHSRFCPYCITGYEGVVVEKGVGTLIGRPGVARAVADRERQMEVPF